MRVQASGLVVVAERLRAAAAQLGAPGVVVHPPLAADQTSVAAATRLSAAAAALHTAAAAQSAALAATADQLVDVATRFTVQETLNSATLQTMSSSAAGPIQTVDGLGPVPSVPDDARPPLAAAVAVDGEVAARQLWAGTASAGTDFVQSLRAKATGAVATRDAIRDFAATLPDLWRSPAGTETVTARLLRHASEVEVLANRAGELADQATDHARSFTAAVATIPTPDEFEAVRDRLRQALDANRRSGGRYSPLVSSLIAEQGALQQQALNTQAHYHGETETGTQAEQAGQLAGQLPGLLGAIGGMLGGAVAAAMQLPQTLMQPGQQLAQTAAQTLSGLATSPAHGKDSAATEFAPPRGTSDAAAAPSATVAAGATDMPLVSPSTSFAPPPSTPVPQGAPAPGTAPAAGPGAVPMGMPMGMVGSPDAADGGKQVPADKKIVVPVSPHAESVTGKVTAPRLVAAAQGSS